MPDPQTLAEYGHVHKDLPERIVKMAEESVYSKADSLRDTSKAHSRAVLIGALGYWVSTGMFVAGGIGLILHGHSEGFFLFTVPVLLQVPDIIERIHDIFKK